MKETIYSCKGNLITVYENKIIESEQSTIFMKLNEYRWWVHLWSDSDGHLNVEIPNKHLEYYPNLQKVMDIYYLRDFDGTFKGDFSTLSNTTQLDISNKKFSGKCELIKK